MNKTINDWRNLSEICFGLIVTGRVDMTKFSATSFCDGYEDGFKEWFKSKNKTLVAKKLGADYETAIQAADTITEDSATEVEWHKILHKSYLAYQNGDRAVRLGKKLMQGIEVGSKDVQELATSLKDLANPDSVGLVQSNTIDLEGYIPTELSGYPPIDTHLGGIVKSGPILVMGTTGIGKSLFSQQFIGHWLLQYPERKAAIYSLEMTNEDYLSRGLKLYPKFKQAHDDGRIFVSDRTTSVHDIGIECASSGVNFIIVDYIDYLISGEGSEGKYAEVYVEMNNIARNLRIPFMMLLQPNRQTYSSGVPEKYHARYSGMAENVATQFWALWKPRDEDECNGDFTYIEDAYYILCHKQRFGWMKSKKGPGAIVIPETKNVWSDEPGVWIQRGDIPQSTKRRKKE